MASTHPTPPLKLLPAYLGVSSLEEALAHPRIARVLWLEILVNDAIEWTAMPHSSVQEAYRLACRWYTRYRTLVSSLIRRSPLPEDPGDVDDRLYRQFAEALDFAHTHS